MGNFTLTDGVDNSTVRLNATRKQPMSPGVPNTYQFYRSIDDCLDALGPRAYAPPDANEPYCNGTFDKILCWEAVPGGTIAKMNCPPLRGLDPTKFGYKKCGPEGLWEGKTPGDYSVPVGWTNYTDCYTDEARKIYDKLFSKTSPQQLKEIAYGAKVMEMVGLSVSLLSLAISIFIFCYFRSLRCDRTRMHRNLFVAILIHVTISLIVNVDQLVAWSTGEDVAGSVGDTEGTIRDTKILCEILVTLVEFTKTVMFMWMFIEGMYLHNMIVVSVFSGKPNYILYYLIGWGFPVILTLAWAITNGILYKEEAHCWFGYHFLPYYWILEGPRAAIIAVNLIFLTNIVRVLVTKLRENNSAEATQVRKAVKAAIVLLPLLGANNFLALVPPPMDNVVKFALYSYAVQFFISFQGFFISLLYCFLNSEVQQTLKRHWIQPMTLRKSLKRNSTRTAEAGYYIMQYTPGTAARQTQSVASPGDRYEWSCTKEIVT